MINTHKLSYDDQKKALKASEDEYNLIIDNHIYNSLRTNQQDTRDDDVETLKIFRPKDIEDIIREHGSKVHQIVRKIAHDIEAILSKMDKESAEYKALRPLFIGTCTNNLGSTLLSLAFHLNDIESQPSLSYHINNTRVELGSSFVMITAYCPDNSSTFVIKTVFETLVVFSVIEILLTDTENLSNYWQRLKAYFHRNSFNIYWNITCYGRGMDELVTAEVLKLYDEIFKFPFVKSLTMLKLPIITDEPSTPKNDIKTTLIKNMIIHYINSDSTPSYTDDPNYSLINAKNLIEDLSDRISLSSFNRYFHSHKEIKETITESDEYISNRLIDKISYELRDIVLSSEEEAKVITANTNNKVQKLEKIRMKMVKHKKVIKAIRVEYTKTKIARDQMQAERDMAEIELKRARQEIDELKIANIKTDATIKALEKEVRILYEENQQYQTKLTETENNLTQVTLAFECYKRDTQTTIQILIARIEKLEKDHEK